MELRGWRFEPPHSSSQIQKRPTVLPTRGRCGVSIIIYNIYLYKSAVEEKKTIRTKNRTRLMEDGKKRVPLIYQGATALLLKIFPTFITKYTENVENVDSAFSILCVVPKLFSMEIFSITCNLTYFQVYFSFSLKMKMKMIKPNTPLCFYFVRFLPIFIVHLS